MNIYHSPHARRVAENAFVTTIVHAVPDAAYIQRNFPIRLEYLEKPVLTKVLLTALENDRLLPNAKRQRCLEILEKCPPRLKVAHLPHRVSFDLVIETDDGVFYWEFHEPQHRRLTVNRDAVVYNFETGEAIVVPRFFQRLVRDVWRFQNFESITVVWKDWFEANQATFKPRLKPGMNEYSLDGQFSFREFLNGG
jgi:hypothetical protein